MNRQYFETIMDGDSNLDSLGDDNAVVGILIIRKYIPKAGIGAAGHDIIYSVGVDEAAVVYGTKITTGVNDKKKRWYYGEHKEDDDGKVLAVRIS